MPIMKAMTISFVAWWKGSGFIKTVSARGQGGTTDRGGEMEVESWECD